MASLIFHNAALEFMQADIDLENDTLKAMLVDVAPSADDVFASGPAANEYDGSYTRPTLATIALTDDDGNNWAKFASATITFSSVGAGSGNAVGLVIYKNVTTDADSPVICYCEFTASIMGNGGDITVACPTNGWLTIG